MTHPGNSRFLRVRMDLTSRCNLRCRTCHFSIPGFRVGSHDMTDEVLSRIVNEIFPRTKELYLSCSTEPMMSPMFGKVLELLPEFNFDHTEFTSNATMMGPHMIEKILRSKIRKIVISMDGATASTFENIRVLANFDRVVGNIRALQEAKTLIGTALPEIAFNMVLMKSNIHELPDLIELARQLGVRQVGCVHMIPNAALNNLDESLQNQKQQTNRVLDEARRQSDTYGMTFYSPKNFSEVETQSVPGTCSCPTEEIVIFPDGKVNPCGVWQDGWFGDLSNECFDTIWQGLRYQELRDAFKTGNLLRSCRVCPTMACGNVDNPTAFEVVQLQ